MKYSKLFGKTVREAKRDMTAVSHKLLYQAGFIRESVAGRYYLLPLGMKVHEKLAMIIEEEMNKAGGQKMITPVLHPIELWEETNRTKSVGFELMVMEDRRGARFALGGTAEEMFVDVVRDFNISYKDLPFILYQFSTKFRDEKRARGGLLRLREFVMKDAYSFDQNEQDFAKTYDLLGNTYSSIFTKAGLSAHRVLADNGYIGGDYCHEYIVDSDAGESVYFVSDDGKVAEHEDVARFSKTSEAQNENQQELKMVDAPRGTTMEDGVKLHNMPLWKQIKDVMYKDESGRFILAVIRGELDVNETKLKKLLSVNVLDMATDEEIREKLHSEPGFISPVDIKKNLQKGVELVIVGDDSLRTVVNAYGGANAKNKDYLNINIDRDYKLDGEGDIAMAYDGCTYIDDKTILHKKKGIEVGNIFQLGYYYSHKMKGSVFTDENGKEIEYYMGCYGIGLARTLAAVVEVHHDERGIIWPESIAPYKYHLVGLDYSDKAVAELTDKVYEKLNGDVLWDDRIDLSAGAKFADADLIGCPIRLVVSKRSLDAGGIEFKRRDEKESKIVGMEELE